MRTSRARQFLIGKKLFWEGIIDHCNILICKQKHSQHNNDERNSSLEKYTSHTLFEMVRNGYERVFVWEVSWRLNKDCNILTPSTYFPFCWAAQPGALRAQLSAGFGSHCFELQQLTPNSDLQLTRTSCSTGLYNCLTPICFSERRICTQFNPSTVKGIPWYLRPDAPVIYTGAFLIWQLGRVGGQYVTPLEFIFNPRKELSKVTTSRIIRWAVRLMAFDFDIEYVKRNSIAHVDALSRLRFLQGVQK